MARRIFWSKWHLQAYCMYMLFALFREESTFLN
jgi:hypothetical protein